MNRKMLALGAGFAVTLAVITAGVLAYVARPRPEPPWNDAFDARLSDIGVWQTVDSTGKANGSGSIEFTYVVQNGTRKDYSTDGESVVAMAQRPDGLMPLDSGSHVEYPIFIPAGSKVAVKISIPYADALGEVARGEERKAVREKLPKLAGFVLFDRRAHCRISFPKDW
jgi:hypothetical protein